VDAKRKKLQIHTIFNLNSLFFLHIPEVKKFNNARGAQALPAKTLKEHYALASPLAGAGGRATLAPHASLHGSALRSGTLMELQGH